uniref:Spectrin repeat containing nuclear envelope family member 4 n=1 Tax=Rattus norvegicus TaxID=10116 RepID=A0A0G2JWQ6_RAT
MAQFPLLGHGFPPEPVNHPLGGPRGLDVAGPTICPAPEEEPSRPEQVQASLDAPEHFMDEPKSTESATSPSKLPLASSHEHQDGGKPCEHSVSGLEVLEAEQDSLHLCLLGLKFRLQDLEQGLASWTLAHNRIVQLQALQAELQGAAERVDALLVFGEGLAERSEPRAWTSLEQVLRALGTHRDTIFQRLWQLQAQLISYSLVLEKANLLDQDLEVEGDSDGPAAGGVWGPWAPSIFPTPAELEWDPAGDVGGLGPSGQKISRIPGAPCELCGYRGSQSSGQGFEVRSAPSKAPYLTGPHKVPFCTLLVWPFPLNEDLALSLPLSLSCSNYYHYYYYYYYHYYYRQIHAMRYRLALNSQSSCLSLFSAGVIGMPAYVSTLAVTMILLCTLYLLASMNPFASLLSSVTVASFLTSLCCRHNPDPSLSTAATPISKSYLHARLTSPSSVQFPYATSSESRCDPT